jgi:polysaccharide export outer membrane protein
MMTRTSRLFVLLASVTLAGCSTFPSYIPAAGPSTEQVVEAPKKQPDSGIQVVELSSEVVRRVQAAQRRNSLTETFGQGAASSYTVGLGDALEISVWEAPPAALFGSSISDSRTGMSTSSRVTVLPEQVVGSNGNVSMPFAGSIQAVGRTTDQIEQEITRRLKPKANDPQVLVRVIRNVSSKVTVVGEVNTSVLMPLSARGERVLDALAAAGGVKQPVGKITVQVTREVRANGTRSVRVQSVPLDTIITDPNQNIALHPGDVVTALHLTNSLTVLGATTRNEEINFEAQGITLAQALARAGGLQDIRAHANGVFIFRYEDPAVLGQPAPTRLTADGKAPVVYRVNLRDPATFFAAQGFPMRNRDVMFVANAPAADLQKFLNILSSVVVPTVTLQNLTQ